MKGLHHAAIVTADVETSLRFWRDGLGLSEIFDMEFHGDWPTLFGTSTDTLRSIFLGDPENSGGIVELVVFDNAVEAPPQPTGPAHGLFLLSFERNVAVTLDTLARLGFQDDVRRAEVSGGGGSVVPMAVITGPDGVRVELIGGQE